MTQLDLANKINYSDKAVSRWEKGEVMPDIETLQSISKVFSVPISYLLEKHKDNKFVESQTQNDAIVAALISCVAWCIVTILFVYLKVFYGKIFWQAFVWGIPATALIVLWFSRKWNSKTYKIVGKSVFTWSLLASIYLHFIKYNLWLIFIIGIPIQAAIIVSVFRKPKIKEENENLQ